MHLEVFCQNIEDKWPHQKPADLIVYHGFSESFVNRLPCFYEYLSDNEKSRADRFKQESDYNCFVSVHALLRIELSKILGGKAKSIRLVESENGKPFIQGIDLPFSLSRTKDMFAFVVGHSNQFLGIDIEKIKPEIDFINISRNYFSVKEQQLILSFCDMAHQKRTFFEIWTRKEALLKAIGIGIVTELRDVQVLDGRNTFEIKGVQNDHSKFNISTIMNDSTLVSIASSKDFIPEFIQLTV